MWSERLQTDQKIPIWTCVCAPLYLAGVACMTYNVLWLAVVLSARLLVTRVCCHLVAMCGYYSWLLYMLCLLRVVMWGYYSWLLYMLCLLPVVMWGYYSWLSYMLCLLPVVMWGYYSWLSYVPIYVTLPPITQPIKPPLRGRSTYRSSLWSRSAQPLGAAWLLGPGASTTTPTTEKGN